MMKLLSLAAVAGSAAAAEEAPRRRLNGVSRRLKGGSRRPDGPTTEELESETRQFIEETLGRPTIGKPRQLHRTESQRGWREGGKSGKYGGDDEVWEDDEWSSGGSKGGKGYRGGYSKSGKNGKYRSGSSKGSKMGTWDDDDWEQGEHFYILPSACPGECVSSHVSDTDEMLDSLKECRPDEESQMWLVRSDSSYIKVESHMDPGMCIAVDYERGDDEAMLVRTCKDGVLFLKDCDTPDGESTHGTEWYFTGGQLVNSLCWAAGLSSMMTVFVDTENKDDEMQECFKDLLVYGLNQEAVLKADTFMFVDRLPESPFYLNTEEVNDYINGKSKPSGKSKSRNGNANNKDNIEWDDAVEFLEDAEGDA